MTAPVADRIDVGPLREAFLASGVTLTEVCVRLGWTCRRSDRPHQRKADTARLKRALGMQASYNPSRRAYSSVATRIGYDLAARIAEAIGVDPYEVGL